MRRWVLYLFLAVFLLGGCARRNVVITDVPAGVSSAEVHRWYEATGTLKAISDTTHNIQQMVLGLNRSGAFPDSEAYITTLQVLGRMDQLQIETARYLQTVPQTFGVNTQQQVSATAEQLATAFQRLNAAGLVGIKNPESRTAVDTLARTLQLSIQNLSALLVQ